MGGCHITGAGTHFLKKEVSGGAVASSNILALEHGPGFQDRLFHLGSADEFGIF